MCGCLQCNIFIYYYINGHDSSLALFYQMISKQVYLLIFYFYFVCGETDYRPSIFHHSKKIKRNVFRKVCLSHIGTYILLGNAILSMVCTLSVFLYIGETSV